ncbi:hypothetical protein YC2023_075209 [Brassica napus]
MVQTCNPSKGKERGQEPSLNGLKEQIWLLKAPRKIKHFLCQALSDSIAASSRLVDRHCGQDRSSLRCGSDNESVNHILFTCPPALQTWALSEIPSAPGVFSSNSLYENFDYLLCRAKQNGATSTMLACFPWVAWFIWKARNDKVFNGKDILPPDTVNHSRQEAEEWRVAQVIQQIVPRTETPDSREDARSKPCLPRCQVDTSWMANSEVFGGGFVLETEPENHLYSSIGKEQVLPPLHAEFSSLLWAMKYSWHLGFISMNFESDCLQLVNLINDEEEWPSLVSEWNEFVHLRSYFTSFSLSYISRKSNVRADLFAKGARAQNLNFSHVNALIPVWLTPKANLFESS